MDQSTAVLLAALVGGLFAFLGGLSGIFANLWMENLRARRERLNEVRQTLIGESIQTSEVMNFIDLQRKRKWPWFWKQTQAELSHAELERVNLRKQDLQGVLFYRTNLANADLEYSNLKGAVLSKAILRQADLHRADMKHADLEGADLDQTNLSYANLNNANLRNAILRGANLEWAKLQGANLTKASLENAKLRAAEIDHSTQIAPKWRVVWEIVNNGGQERNLEGANLEDASLVGANLEGANLRGAYLHNTNFRKANLQRANLAGALCSAMTNFQGTDLRGAILSGTKLLSYAQLKGAKYDHSTVWPEGVNKSRAILTDFYMNDVQASSEEEYSNNKVPGNDEDSTRDHIT